MTHDVEEISGDLSDEQRELARRVMEFEIDPGDHAFNFKQRLAKENRWTEGFAARVIHEYKRFIALAVVAGHPVTPSEAVDEAWHLHLSYTHSYWERLCTGVIGRPLHHTPTQGGSAQAEHYWDQYELTRESYNRVFLEHPPLDLWPPASQRFGTPKPNPNTKDPNDTLTFRRWSVIGHAVVLGVMLIAMGVAMFVCGPTTQVGVFLILIAYLVIHVCAVMYELGWFLGLGLQISRRTSGGCGTFGCGGGCGSGCGGGCGGC